MILIERIAIMLVIENVLQPLPLLDRATVKMSMSDFRIFENPVVCTSPLRFDCLTLDIPGWIGNLKLADKRWGRKGNTTMNNDWNL